MCDEKTVKVLLRVDGTSPSACGNTDILEAVRKQRKQIRGIKGLIFALTVGGIVLAAELAERKRSENYLQGEIDRLKEDHDRLVDEVLAAHSNVDAHDETYSGGVSDA